MRRKIPEETTERQEVAFSEHILELEKIFFCIMSLAHRILKIIYIWDFDKSKI